MGTNNEIQGLKESRSILLHCVQFSSSPWSISELSLGFICQKGWCIVLCWKPQNQYLLLFRLYPFWILEKAFDLHHPGIQDHECLPPELTLFCRGPTCKFSQVKTTPAPGWNTFGKATGRGRLHRISCNMSWQFLYHFCRVTDEVTDKMFSRWIFMPNSNTQMDALILSISNHASVVFFMLSITILARSICSSLQNDLVLVQNQWKDGQTKGGAHTSRMSKERWAHRNGH